MFSVKTGCGQKWGLPGLFRYILESVLGNSIEHFTDLSLGRNYLVHKSFNSHLWGLRPGTEKNSLMGYLFQSCLYPTLSGVLRGPRQASSAWAGGWSPSWTQSAAPRTDWTAASWWWWSSARPRSSAPPPASPRGQWRLSSGARGQPRAESSDPPGQRHLGKLGGVTISTINKKFSPPTVCTGRVRVNSGSAFMFSRNKF